MIKPCPFCNQAPKTSEVFKEIHCDNPDCRIPYLKGPSWEDVIAKWNKRSGFQIETNTKFIPGNFSTTGTITNVTWYSVTRSKNTINGATIPISSRFDASANRSINASFLTAKASPKWLVDMQDATLHHHRSVITGNQVFEISKFESIQKDDHFTLIIDDTCKDSFILLNLITDQTRTTDKEYVGSADLWVGSLPKVNIHVYRLDSDQQGWRAMIHERSNWACMAVPL